MVDVVEGIMPDKVLLRQEMSRISELLIARYCGKNGLLVEYVDAAKSEILRRGSVVQDFGDYAQNVAFAGKLLGRRDWVDWAVGQIGIGSKLFQTREGYFLPDGSTDVQENSRPKFKYFRLEDNQDLVMGILSVYRLSGDKMLLDIAGRLMDFVFGHSENNNRLYANVFFLTPWKAVVLPYHLPCGVFIEEMANLSRITQDRTYQDRAMASIKVWDSNKVYSNTGIFPVAAPAYSGWTSFVGGALTAIDFNGTGKKCRVSLMIKSNTNMLSAMLELYRQTGDSDIRQRINRWLEFVQENLMDERGFFYGAWDHSGRRRQSGKYPLAENGHISNIFLDAAVFLKEDSLLVAVNKNLDFWLANRTPLGLFPEMKSDWPAAVLLDSQVDMSIVFLKAYNVTGDQRYLTAVVDGTKALIKHFRAPGGWFWAIDGKTGQPVKDKIFTKYLALSLKLLALLDAVMDGKNIYNDPDLFDLSRDR